MSEEQSPQQIAKQNILNELQNITDEQILTEINDVIENQSEDLKPKIDGINIASNGDINYYNGTTQLSIQNSDINTMRLEGTLNVRIGLTNPNTEQILLKLLHVVNRLGVFGYKITDSNKETSPPARTFTLTKTYNTGVMNL